MRVWIDLTNSPHVLVLRPVIRVLEERGAEVRVTARDFAQTLGLCERFGIPYEPIGRHRGGRLASKGVGLASRSSALARWARGRRFDLAMGHGSNDVTIAARLLRIPVSTAFDYEWARVQHQVNCRLAQAVVVPEAIPPARLAPYGATPAKLRRYPGLKEEYYLADFEPHPPVRAGADPPRAPRAHRRDAGEAAPLPRAQGGVLPGGLRPRSRRARRVGPGRRAAARGRAHAAVGLAVSPLREPAVRAGARAPARR